MILLRALGWGIGIWITVTLVIFKIFDWKLDLFWRKERKPDLPIPDVAPAVAFMFSITIGFLLALAVFLIMI